MRERLVQKCAKRGRFMLHQRLNVDQRPLPFSLDAMKTYELVKPGNSENRTKSGYPGASKRSCSPNVYFCPKGEETRLAVIFRGRGKRISEAVKQVWSKDIDVYFQS